VSRRCDRAGGADIGLAGDGQRLVKQPLGLFVQAAVKRDLGSPLQRERLARCGRDLAVELRTCDEVVVRLVELSAEQLRLASQCHRGRAAACGTDPHGLRLERVGRTRSRRDTVALRRGASA